MESKIRVEAPFLTFAERNHKIASKTTFPHSKTAHHVRIQFWKRSFKEF